ncbi:MULTISPECIES: hypothetical protein [unclassified Phaeobacter]|uniref:hypothetical protein n=1 Tax=unclassified Phaeobacter TaxID=2621772 RepID=UPI003A86A35B
MSTLRHFFSLRASGDFRVGDILLLILFAIIGLQGYARFPAYRLVLEDISAVPFTWTIAIATFNYLLVHKKIRICYIADLEAYLVAAILFFLLSICLHAILSAGVADFNFFSKPALLSTQAGLATLLLIVQGWFTFSPDLSKVRHRKKDLDRLLGQIATGRVDTEKDKRKAQEICQDLIADLKASISGVGVSEETRSRLEGLDAYYSKVSSILRKPTGALKNDVKKLIGDHQNG